MTTTSASPEDDRISPQTWFAIVMLTFVIMFNYADRYLIAILVQPIKADLGISDAQVGLLTGFAFSAFYAIAALPLARWADRGVRRDVVVVSLIAWSAMTALSGLTRSFAQLFVTRVGVGVGEAGSIPASHSMIADLVPPRKRAFAYALYSAGGSLGLSLAFVVGGALEAKLGWRGTFIAVGLPGVVLALVLRLTVREPARGRYAALEKLAPKEASAQPNPFRALLADSAYRWVLIASCFSVLAAFGGTQWVPAFVERSFGGSRSGIGASLAASQGVGQLIGMLAGGLLSDRLSRNDPAMPFRVLIVAALVATPFYVGSYLAPTANFYYGCAFAGAFVGAISTGASVVVIQAVVSPTMRAAASAMVAFGAAFLGSGCGPFVIGLLSDALRPLAGVESLRYALLIVVGPAYLLTMASYMLALRRVRARIAVG